LSFALRASFVVIGFDLFGFTNGVDIIIKFNSDGIQLGNHSFIVVIINQFLLFALVNQVLDSNNDPLE